MSRFLSFSEALVFARSLQLNSSTEWRAWCKAGMRPPDVPSNPYVAYKDGGWQGWGHWLGGTRSQSNKVGGATEFLPFGEALAVARSLGLAGKAEWKVWCRGGTRPLSVPPNPHTTYKGGGWRGWSHWLGTGSQSNKTKNEQFLPFGEAVALAQSLGFASRPEWKAWCKKGLRPASVPSNPNQTYKGGGWQGWGHWLGTGTIKPGTEKLLPFAEALAVSRSLGLAGSVEWKAWCKTGARPPGVPSNPTRAYKASGWRGWGHWLGTGALRAPPARRFLPFGEAVVVARSLGLGSSKKWAAWCREGQRPRNLPTNPHQAYKNDGWQGWVHWLGSAGLKKPSKFVPFIEARSMARSLGLANSQGWVEWCRRGARPPNVPSHPQTTCVTKAGTIHV